MKKLLNAAWLLLLCDIANGQIAFQKSNLFDQNSFRSGLVMGISDMNGDGYEDLIRLDKDKNLHFDYQISQQEQFTQKFIGTPTGASNWSLTIGDIDNNGYNDIVLGGNATGVKILLMDRGRIYIKRIASTRIRILCSRNKFSRHQC